MSELAEVFKSSISGFFRSAKEEEEEQEEKSTEGDKKETSGQEVRRTNGGLQIGNK